MSKVVKVGQWRSEGKCRLTSMWRSVALVNESITIDSTPGSDKCAGCVVPTAATWFLKYIYERNAPHERFRRKLRQMVQIWIEFGKARSHAPKPRRRKKCIGGK